MTGFFDPSRFSSTAGNGRAAVATTLSTCCWAPLLPQKVLYEGEVFEAARCAVCGDLRCPDCGGELDGAEPVEDQD